MSQGRLPLVPGSQSTREALREAAAESGPQAHAAHSGLYVGAALLSASGAVYKGCNVENAAYPLGGCAEEAAIAAGVLAEGRAFRIAELAVRATDAAGKTVAISPCGGCRQRIYEFAANGSTLIHFDWPVGQVRSLSIGELLPCAFQLPPGGP